MSSYKLDPRVFSPAGQRALAASLSGMPDTSKSATCATDGNKLPATSAPFATSGVAPAVRTRGTYR